MNIVVKQEIKLRSGQHQRSNGCGFLGVIKSGKTVSGINGDTGIQQHRKFKGKSCWPENEVERGGNPEK